LINERKLKIELNRASVKIAGYSGSYLYHSIGYITYKCGLYYVLFPYTHMKSVEIVSYSYLEPLFGILFSVIFVGETLTLPQIMGGILILGSTYIGEMLKDGKLSNIDTFMEQQNNKQNSKKTALFFEKGAERVSQAITCNFLS